MKQTKTTKAYVVAVDMGYGHERAAYALKEISSGPIYIANNYKGIPREERARWKTQREGYEAVSRLKSVPVVGDLLFEVMDEFQEIDPFYPRRDLSKPSLQLRQTYNSIKKGLGRHLIEHLSKRPLPLIATFFQAAFTAEENNYPGDIYCVICDADCSRAWAPLNPKQSRIKYLAPNGRVVERLKLYGVPEENIFLTGFPLPKELIGGPNYPTIRLDLSRRLKNLDPNRIFINKYKKTLTDNLGKNWLKLNHKHPLTLTFALGGAGAQRSLGTQILTSLAQSITSKKIRLNLIVGTHHDGLHYYRENVRDLHLNKYLGSWINIVHSETREKYFKQFSQVLHTTDILWTKPSELSFYTGLGLPIIIAPPIGSQEQFNKLWLKTVGGGITQNDPRYTNEWLFDWINSGGLARVAWNGFIEAPTHGAYRIENLITGRKTKLEQIPLIV